MLNVKLVFYRLYKVRYNNSENGFVQLVDTKSLDPL